MRNFTVSELWGPFPCEYPGCKNKECFSILLSSAENKQLPEQSGPEAVKYIFDNKLGIAICERHTYDINEDEYCRLADLEVK